MRRTLLTLTALSALAISGPAMAAGGHDSTDVSKASEGQWISLTGTVKAVSPERFTMNYGKGSIVVEMDDYDWYDENFMLPGAKVTVTGIMDNDFFENKKVEASTVYLPNRKEYYYASAADEEDGYYSFPIASYDWGNGARDDEWVVFTGTVKRVEGNELTLDTGTRELTVDASTAAGGLLDAEGDPLVDVGDRVSVSGEMDDADFFDGREIEASSVTLLINNAA
jgi:uncharacterized protein YdeI (BOF family)